VPDATTELEHASADIVLTRDAREILDRAAKVATARGSLHIVPADVFNATLQLPGNLADAEMRMAAAERKSAQNNAKNEKDRRPRGRLRWR